MNIHQDLEAIKMVAIEETKNDGYNYNIILHNPNANGEFDMDAGSTYEFVSDSYFNTPRPNVILLHKTKDLLQLKEVDKLINHLTQVPEGYDRIREDMAKIDIATSSESQAEKLKKGLSMVRAQADGVTYRQGRSGLERMANTNRNDKCNCGSGKKFKKCCGK